MNTELDHRTSPTGLDSKDQDILHRRLGELAAVEGPRVGDFVRFADGTTRRISYIWRDWDDTMADLPDHERPITSVQTSDGGSYYLGNGWVSMSGSLYPGVPVDTLTATNETRVGSVWFFHHDQWRAHNGVGATVPFRVFTCSLIPDGHRYREAVH